MIDTNAIKDRILSFAYQGKLIEPNKVSDDNLELIHGKIKGFIPVSDEEYLINAPKEWKWTRLGYVTSNHGQVTPSDTFSYIDVGTLDNVNHRLSASENIVEAKDAPSRAKKVVETGDVIYSTVRPYLHNICIIDKDFSYTPIASTAFCVMCANEEVLDNRYLFYWLLTKEFDKYSNGDPSKGALYPAIGEKDLLKGIIPLPSVIEQKAIVEKIETIFEILDKIDALQDQYASNQEALKSKLIDAAIQGKLTEQLPEDGTAESLLEEIEKEKDSLVKAKKIKKTKELSDIEEGEIPFEIPSNWKWVKIGEAFTLQAGKNITAPEIKDEPDDSYCYLCYGGNGVRGYVTQSNVSGRHVLIGRQGALCGNINMADGDFYATEHAVVVYQYADTDPDWAGYVLKALNLNQYATSVAQPGLAVGKIEKVWMPLPPVAEQKRIARTIENLLAAINIAG